MHSAIQSGFEKLPSLTPVRPMLMLTGFLGAGKTTLLRDILDELSRYEHLADVILNDRENARLDRETLRDHAVSVEALTGSCVCCEGLDQLCGMILKAAKTAHEILLIELNGTADPVPLQETFTLLESNFLLQPRWQVCVIDGRHFGHRSHFRELEKLQLETASHYYLSHASSLTAQELNQLTQTVKAINPRASQTDAPKLAKALSQAVRQGRRFALTTAQEGGQSSYKRPTPHLHDRHQLAHEFTGCNIIFPTVIDDSRVIPWLENLPASVIRAKALMTLRSDPGRRHLYERVGQEIPPRPIPVRAIDKVPCSGLFIGPDLHPEEILQLTCKTLHPDCHFPSK